MYDYQIQLHDNSCFVIPAAQKAILNILFLKNMLLIKNIFLIKEYTFNNEYIFNKRNTFLALNDLSELPYCFIIPTSITS